MSHFPKAKSTSEDTLVCCPSDISLGYMTIADASSLADHCIDLLRQAIMCTGDMGLMTYNWVLDAPAMFPDFDTKHRCRNFDKLLKWGERTMIDKTPSQGWNSSNRLGVKFLDGDDGIF